MHELSLRLQLLFLVIRSLTAAEGELLFVAVSYIYRFCSMDVGGKKITDINEP